MSLRLLLAVLPLAALAACDTNIEPIENSNVTIATGEASEVAPNARPVRIGESGSASGACATRGTVVETGLQLRPAPFAASEAIAEVPLGTRLFVCGQTIDQRWMGVVVPPADQPDLDCGVTTRVPSPRAYEGPCPSGWVASAFVRTVTG